MKYTLLDMVQTILSSMSSDEVDSINDNSEATAVARIVRSCYYDIVGPQVFPENYNMFQLEASGDATKPVLMTKPSYANSVQWIRYDYATVANPDPTWTEVQFRYLNEFLKITQGLVLSDDNVGSFNQPIGTSSIQFLYRNDVAPHWFTSYDDNTIIFDSYNSAVDTTLQKVKTMAWGNVGETFQLNDSYIPPIDANVFPLLLNESKAMAWAELLRTTHAKAEKNVRNHRVNLQRTRASYGNQTDIYRLLPNYGRK